MSVRMRHTKGHTGNRRSHHALKGMKIVTDKASGNLRLPHRLDEASGMYRGKLVVEPRAKATKAPKATKVKGKNTEPTAPRLHDHAHDHANAAAKPASANKGFFGKFMGGGRPKARSGAGGGLA